MQKEKTNVLIVVIAAVVIIGVAIGLFFLISFVKDRNYKKEHWFESDTTIITIQNDHTKEGTQEVKLSKKDSVDSNGVEVLFVEFTLTDNTYVERNFDIGIVNDGVVIRELGRVSSAKDKDFARRSINDGEMIQGDGVAYEKLFYNLYKHSDDDSLEFFKVIEIHLHYDTEKYPFK
ncbi:MAG: hypothetical protein V8R51_01760 [Clostridia bacterium]